MPFNFTPLNIPDIMLIEPRIFRDERGYFFESFKTSDFHSVGIAGTPVQINHSMSSRGVIRGLHYQKNPRAQAKLVRVISGRIFDVGVDIRENSPHYGKWAGAELTAENRKMLYLPRGFAHGFCVLSETAEVEYCVFGGEYSPDNDRGIIWNDPDIGIDWPEEKPVLSPKDSALPALKDAENNFIYLKID